MNDEYEEMTMVNALTAHVCSLVETLDDMDVQSEEYAVVSKVVEELSSICIKIREIEMRYDDNECQRQHEMKVKKLEQEAAERAKEAEMKLKEIEQKEIRRWHNIDMGLKIATVLVSLVGTCAFTWTAWCQTRMNYVDNVYDVNQGSRMILQAIGNRVKPNQL